MSYVRLFDDATVVIESNLDLGYWVAEEMPYFRWSNETLVQSEVTVMQMLTGYMPPLPIPTYYYGNVLTVEVDYPDDGYMQAVWLPYTFRHGHLRVESNQIAHGWAEPSRLPYERREDALVVSAYTYGENGWCQAWALPYERREDALVVTLSFSSEGFEVAEDYKPVPVYSYSEDVMEVLGVETPGDELVFGLELESNTGNCDLMPLALTKKGIWKQDSSCGVEFVTKPMGIEEMLEFAHKAPVQTLSPDSHCGMHLHVNRKALTQRQICLLALLISSEEYANEIDQIAGRRSNDFCKKVKKTEEEVLNTDDRYEAVNLTNFSPSKYTVEIRIFAGTRFNHHLVERVLWVYQLVQFVKSPFASADYGDFLAYQQKLSGFIKHLVK